MKGKWYTLAAGIALMILAGITRTYFRFPLLLIASLYFFLAGILFERYATSVVNFTGFTTEKDLPTGDLRLVAPVGLDGGGSRRLELNIEDIVKMDDPIAETAKFLDNAGFDMNRDIIWWDDPDTKNRIFTQEVQ